MQANQKIFFAECSKFLIFHLAGRTHTLWNNLKVHLFPLTPSIRDYPGELSCSLREMPFPSIKQRGIPVRIWSNSDHVAS